MSDAATQPYLASYERLARQNAQPGWLRERRREGIERFADFGFPSTDLEDWKYTPVRAIAKAAPCLEAVGGKTCQARDVELIAVEIPAYGDPRMSSAYRSFLEGIGATVVTCAQPEELFVPENWFDRGHMNVWGAAVMSDRFVEQLQRLDNPPIN